MNMSCLCYLVVTYIGKGGYWEGRAGGQEGWFPRLAIKEAGEEEYDDYPPTIPVTPHTPSSMKSDNTQTSRYVQHFNRVVCTYTL